VTLYAGETVQVRHAAFGFDKQRLSPDDGVVATITVWALDGETVLVDEAAMSYDAGLKFDDGGTGGWLYHWDTPEVPGAYEARCRVAGAGGIDAWEFKTIRVRRNRR
jgi:hypothetical protein